MWLHHLIIRYMVTSPDHTIYGHITLDRSICGYITICVYIIELGCGESVRMRMLRIVGFGCFVGDRLLHLSTSFKAAGEVYTTLGHR